MVRVRRTVPGGQADLLGVSTGSVLRKVHGRFIDGRSLQQVGRAIQKARTRALHACFFLEFQAAETYDATLAALGVVGAVLEPPPAAESQGVFLQPVLVRT